MEWVKVFVSTTAQGLDAVFDLLLDNNIVGAEIIDNADMQNFIKDNPFSWDYVDDSLISHNNPESGIVFYVTVDEEGSRQLSDIREGLQLLPLKYSDIKLGSLTVQTEVVDDSV